MSRPVHSDPAQVYDVCCLCSSQFDSDLAGGVSCSFCGSAICPECAKKPGIFPVIACPVCKKQIPTGSSPKKSPQSSPTQKVFPNLADVRVIQRDLVYIVGLPVQYAKEETLIKYEFFGQYGPIKKVVINSQNIHNQPNQAPSVGAYVTFKSAEDANECINAVDNFVIDGSQMKASFGTTKYCSSFLRGQQCLNPDCLYLHHLGEVTDTFSKDEITNMSSRFVEMTRPSRPSDYDDYQKFDARPTVLPPRRVPKKDEVTTALIPQIPFNEVLKKSGEFKEDPVSLDSLPCLPLTEQLHLGGQSPRSLYLSIIGKSGVNISR